MDPYLGLQGCQRARPHPRGIAQGRHLAASHPRHVHQAREYARRPGIFLAAALNRRLHGPPRIRGGSGGGPGRNNPKKFSKSAPPVRAGVSATTLTGGTVEFGSARTGIGFVAASMKRRQACAGSEPPVTLFIGELSSLPSQTPATRSAVYPINHASR